MSKGAENPKHLLAVENKPKNTFKLQMQSKNLLSQLNITTNIFIDFKKTTLSSISRI